MFNVIFKTQFVRILPKHSNVSNFPTLIRLRHLLIIKCSYSHWKLIELSATFQAGIAGRRPRYNQNLHSGTRRTSGRPTSLGDKNRYWKWFLLRLRDMSICAFFFFIARTFKIPFKKKGYFKFFSTYFLTFVVPYHSTKAKEIQEEKVILQQVLTIL